MRIFKESFNLKKKNKFMKENWYFALGFSVLEYMAQTVFLLMSCETENVNDLFGVWIGQSVFQGTVNPLLQYQWWCKLTQTHWSWCIYFPFWLQVFTDKDVWYYIYDKPNPISGSLRLKTNLITLQGPEYDLVWLARLSHELCMLMVVCCYSCTRGKDSARSVLSQGIAWAWKQK